MTDVPMHEKGLGYHYVRDPRADAFLMGERLPDAATLPRPRFWRIGPILDQGREGACVGFAWAAWRNAHPLPGSYDDSYALSVYRRAQRVDEWPGEDYSGTSNQAGAKVMVAEGALKEYVWATSYEDIVRWVKLKGPLVLTMPWYRNMYRTDRRNFIRPGGDLVGGHAMLCYGVSSYGTLRVQNSWGPDFGDKGSAWISKRDWLWLASRDRGWSACAAAEVRRG